MPRRYNVRLGILLVSSGLFGMACLSLRYLPEEVQQSVYRFVSSLDAYLCPAATVVWSVWIIRLGVRMIRKGTSE